MQFIWYRKYLDTSTCHLACFGCDLKGMKLNLFRLVRRERIDGDSLYRENLFHHKAMAVQAQVGRSTRRLCGLLSILTMFFLGGCGLDNFFAARPEVPLELDFNQVLPEGWRPIARWYEVSIDGDADTEYLLLFTYDSGQVGAVIYDQQVSTDLLGPGATGSAESGSRQLDGGSPFPLQAFGYYRPYLLLPSNWDFTYGGEVSHGFIAHPNDADNVVVTPVVRNQNNLATALGIEGQIDNGVIHPQAELVIRGGSTHLTFVWWKNRQEGYGVTQLYAPSGFRGINWQTWREAPRPIDAISGLHPLSDYRARSLLCRETAFRRVGISGLAGADGENGTNGADDGEPTGVSEASVAGASPVVEGLPSIAFVGQDLGIHFCAPTIPTHPFYPEGVALAYLLQANRENGGAASLREGLITSGVSMGAVDGVLNPAGLAFERVSDIQAFPTVPVTAHAIEDGVFSPTTSVCVELADLENPSRRRWLLFTLRYHAPDMEARTPDRWTISGITEQPRPLAAGVGAASVGTVGQQGDSGELRHYCRAILGLEE